VIQQDSLMPIDDEASLERSNRVKQRISLYKEDLSWLMKAQSGRRIVWRWLSEMRFMSPVANSNGLVQSQNAGAHDIGTKIASELLEACPNHFTLMIKESHDRDANRNP
jgi:hypothetical protein